MSNQTIIYCQKCGKRVIIDEKHYSNLKCPKCGMGLPIEGTRDGEYVIICPHGCCRVYTAEEIFKNEAFCPECVEKIPLYLTKHFPCEIKGMMCPRHKNDENFCPEEFDDSECQDCFEEGCLFVDPNWWKEEQEDILVDMFDEPEDDE